jgi:hypothetical protein
MVVMSAVVATLAVVPLALLAAGVCMLVFDASPQALFTFGGALSTPLGLLAWWGLALIPAGIYVAGIRAAG